MSPPKHDDWLDYVGTPEEMAHTIVDLINDCEAWKLTAMNNRSDIHALESRVKLLEEVRKYAYTMRTKGHATCCAFPEFECDCGLVGLTKALNKLAVKK